jgi:hypothetical protein
MPVQTRSQTRSLRDTATNDTNKMLETLTDIDDSLDRILSYTTAYATIPRLHRKILLDKPASSEDFESRFIVARKRQEEIYKEQEQYAIKLFGVINVIIYSILVLYFLYYCL